jgi:hypothetical protein
MREPTKLFPCERVKATSDRLATAGRESTKIRRVHLPRPAQCAKRISVPKCAVGDNGDRYRSGSRAVERTQPYSGPRIGPPAASEWPQFTRRARAIRGSQPCALLGQWIFIRASSPGSSGISHISIFGGRQGRARRLALPMFFDCVVTNHRSLAAA